MLQSHPGDTALQVASAANTAIDSDAAFSSSLSNGHFAARIYMSNIVRITNVLNGGVTSLQIGTMTSTSGSSVTHDNSNSLGTLSNGIGIGHYAILRSTKAVKYRPGQGISSRFTCVFDEPTAGVDQLAGLGTQVSGLFFGYNGDKFGILHRIRGQPEIRKLQITVAPSVTETIQVIIDGIYYDVSVTSSDSIEDVAYKIAAQTDIISGNWIIEAINDTVYLSSVNTPTSGRSNTYGLVNTGNLAGTWTQIAEQIDISTNWIYQDSWNIAKLRGREAGKMVLNPQKGNVFRIDFQWLGFGKIDFFIENDYTGSFELVHTIRYANRFTTPSLIQPTMRIMYELRPVTVASQKTLKLASAAIGVQGEIIPSSIIYNAVAQGVAISSTEVAFLTIYNRKLFNSRISNIEVIPKILQIVNDGTKSGTVRLYKNGTKTNPTNYVHVNENSSCVTYDTTNTDVPTGDVVQIASFQIAGSSNVYIDIDKLRLSLNPGELLTFTGQRNLTTDIELSLSITWYEDQ